MPVIQKFANILRQQLLPVLCATWKNRPEHQVIAEDFLSSSPSFNFCCAHSLSHLWHRGEFSFSAVP